jgi:hypothetical protein
MGVPIVLHNQIHDRQSFFCAHYNRSECPNVELDPTAFPSLFRRFRRGFEEACTDSRSNSTKSTTSSQPFLRTWVGVLTRSCVKESFSKIRQSLPIFSFPGCPTIDSFSITTSVLNAGQCGVAWRTKCLTQNF